MRRKQKKETLREKIARKKREIDEKTLLRDVTWAKHREPEASVRALREQVMRTATALERVARGVEKMVAMVKDHTDPASRLVHVEKWAQEVQYKLAQAGIMVTVLR